LGGEMTDRWKFLIVVCTALAMQSGAVALPGAATCYSA
jgi:hypothetical protein